MCDRALRLVCECLTTGNHTHCTCVQKEAEESQAAGGSSAQGDPVVCAPMRDRFIKATGDGCRDKRSKVLAVERLHLTLRVAECGGIVSASPSASVRDRCEHTACERVRAQERLGVEA